jgi:hypothetical protein
VPNKQCITWLAENVSKITLVHKGMRRIDGIGWTLRYVNNVTPSGHSFCSHIICDIEDGDFATMFMLKFG